MKAELKRAADLVAFQRREALSRKRLSGDPRNPFRPRYGAELTFAAASQEAETLGYGFECVSLLYFKGEVILRLVSDGVKTVTNLRPALSYWEAGASLQCGYKPAS